MHPWHRLPQERVFQGPKRYRWALGVAALEMEEMEQLYALPGPTKDPSVVGLLKVEIKQVPIAMATVHWQRYRTN